MFTLLPRWLQCGREQKQGLMVFAALAVLIALAALTDDAGRDAFALAPDEILDGEVWRVFTGHIVHLSRMHAFMNELGLLFLIVVLWDVLEPVTLLLAIVASALAIAAGVMLFHGNLAYYVGFSGITHGLFAWGGLRILQAGQRGYSALVLTVVAGKLIWEAVKGPTPGASEVIGGVILVESHLYGVVGGVLAALAPPLRWRSPTVLALAAVALLLPAQPVEAHSLEDSTARVQLDENGDVILALDIEAAAFILREPPGALSEQARARVIAMADSDLQDYINGAGDYLLNTVHFFGVSGEVVQPLRIRMPSPAALRRHAETPQETATAQQALLLVFDGTSVRALEQPRLRLPPLIGSLFLIVNRADGSESIDLLPPGVPSEPLDLTTAAGIWQEIGSSIVDGVRHVVPSGWDHALFMAILVLATPAILTCLLHATTFTVAHSITLFLAALGLVNVPSLLVEFGIALTVALAGIETALRLRNGDTAETAPGRRRLLIIFAFGLLHGLGFATVFSDLPVHQASLITSLLGFNIGVELGQIIVIFVVLAILFLLHQLGNDRIATRSRFAMSLAIAAIGSVWVIERAGNLLG